MYDHTSQKHFDDISKRFTTQIISYMCDPFDLWSVIGYLDKSNIA